MHDHCAVKTGPFNLAFLKFESEKQMWAEAKIALIFPKWSGQKYHHHHLLTHEQLACIWTRSLPHCAPTSDTKPLCEGTPVGQGLVFCEGGGGVRGMFLLTPSSPISGVKAAYSHWPRGMRCHIYQTCPHWITPPSRSQHPISPTPPVNTSTSTPPPPSKFSDSLPPSMNVMCLLHRV